jgi:hypothetical protein
MVFYPPICTISNLSSSFSAACQARRYIGNQDNTHNRDAVDEDFPMDYHRLPLRLEEARQVWYGPLGGHCGRSLNL